MSYTPAQETFTATQTPTGTTVTVNLATGRNHRVDFGSASGDVTFTLTNPVAGRTYWIQIIQGATARAAIWPAAVNWEGGTAPTISTTDDDIDDIVLAYDGSTYEGSFLQNMD